MRLLLSNTDISYLNEAFPSINFEFYRSNDEERFISCFVATFPENSSEDELNDWLDITSLIAVNFQESLTNDFEVWNIYLVLVYPQRITRDLKYKIESNRFALRKIVLSPKKSKEQILKLIEDMILGNDLKLSLVKAKALPQVGCSFVRDVIPHIDTLPADSKEESVDIRKEYIEMLLKRV